MSNILLTLHWYSGLLDDLKTKSRMMPGDRVSRKEVQSHDRSYQKGLDNCLHSLLCAGNKYLLQGTHGLQIRGKLTNQERIAASPRHCLTSVWIMLGTMGP